MRIVLCDDDPAVIQQLTALLTEFFTAGNLPLPEYASYLSGEELLKKEDSPASQRIEIAFLDVEMPGISGIQAGARLQARNPYAKIFIVTSYADYLDEAMKFHVFRYLSKPLDPKRLFRNMKDALYQLSVDTRPVVIETAGETVTRYADEIVMVEAQGHRVTVRALDGAYASTQPMKHWEGLLEIGSFYQTHRSFIVNMKYVQGFSPAMITLAPPDGETLSAYMARRRYKNFKQTYMLYVEAMR